MKFGALWLATVVWVLYHERKEAVGGGLGQVKHGMRRGRSRNLLSVRG
jgi:hypothetical protein